MADYLQWHHATMRQLGRFIAEWEVAAVRAFLAMGAAR